jgi:hypothetical protein
LSQNKTGLPLPPSATQLSLSSSLMSIVLTKWRHSLTTIQDIWIWVGKIKQDRTFLFLYLLMCYLWLHGVQLQSCVNGVNCWYNLAVSVQLGFVRHIHSYIFSAWKPYQFIYSQYKNHANSYIRSTKTMPLHIAKVVISKSVHREVYIVWSVNCHGSVVSSC